MWFMFFMRHPHDNFSWDSLRCFVTKFHAIFKIPTGNWLIPRISHAIIVTTKTTQQIPQKVVVWMMAQHTSNNSIENENNCRN